MRGRRRRGQDGPRPQRPSARAEERLRAAVSRDVADLRLQLEEASLRSDAFLWAGHPEVAAEVVDEKRELVSRFESRLQQRLSEAAVEAEAERVLAAAPGAAALSDEPTERAADRRSQALLSALAAALFALLAINGPVTGSGELSSTDGTPPSTGEQEIVALPEAPRTRPAPAQLRRPPAVPQPAPTRSRTTTQRSAGDLPDASPTERLVGIIQGLVDAADGAVRDALRALLAETLEPPVQPVGEAPEAETNEGPPPTPEDGTSDEHEDATEDPSEEDSEDGGDLSSVTEPLDVPDEDGPSEERPAER